MLVILWLLSPHTHERLVGPALIVVAQLKITAPCRGEVRALCLNPHSPSPRKCVWRQWDVWKKIARGKIGGIMASGMELGPSIMQRKQLLMPPLIQQVCRHWDGYSSSAAEVRWEAASSGFMALCAGLSPDPCLVWRAIKVFSSGPTLMEFPTSPAHSHSTGEL